MCFEFDYWVTTDGGALANGTADSAGYGSYHLESRTGQKQVVRLDFGRGVTKQRVCDPAEYRTLIAGLTELADRIQRKGEVPSGYSLLVHTDSQLSVDQLTQVWQVKAANFRSGRRGSGLPSPRQGGKVHKLLTGIGAGGIMLVESGTIVLLCSEVAPRC